MRQLFWRLNIQQYRNVKYKRNKDKADEFEAQRRRSPSHDLGIDTDVVGATSASRDGCGTPGTPRYGSRLYSSTMLFVSHRPCRSSTVINLTDSPIGSHTGFMHPDLHETESHPTNEREISKDLYRVPDSPDPRILPPKVSPLQPQLNCSRAYKISLTF